MENAIEISFKALEENPGKRVYLLSQMIHNPDVNDDLMARGIRFIMDTNGKQFIPWDEITRNDIVIIPAFGTTLEIQSMLAGKGVELRKYDTTCPFVEKVWTRANQLGDQRYTVIIHGKPGHEETRATFSHSAGKAPSLIIRDMAEAKELAMFITGARPLKEFDAAFGGRYSAGFDPGMHLERIGVVNQTTMLAADTQAIADKLKNAVAEKYGSASAHFADTRDTLCYATNDNQDATYELLAVDADIAIVVGGYNSSNTSHIVELCERKFPTFFVSSEKEILAEGAIRHYDLEKKTMVISKNFLPAKRPVKVVLTSGASCPDTVVDRVMLRLLNFFENPLPVETLLNNLTGKRGLP